MAMLWDTYNRYIETVSRLEDSDVRRMYAKEYTILRFLTGLYWDLSTPRGRLMNLAHFVYSTTNFLFTTYILAMNAIKASYWRIDYGLVVLAFLTANVYAYVSYLTLLVFRPRVAWMHKEIATNFFQYSLETETDEEFIQWMASKLKQYMLFVNPTLLSLALAMVFLMRLEVEERYINDLDFSLPLPGCYPFSVDSWFGYLMASLSQVLGGTQTLILIVHGLSVHSFVITKMATQLQRIKSSLNEIERRAFHLVGMLCGRVEFTKKKRMSEFKLYNDNEFVLCVMTCLRENFEHYKIMKKHYEGWISSTTAVYLMAIVLYAVSSGGSAAILTMDGSYLSLKMSSLIIFFNVTFCGFSSCLTGQVVTSLSEDIFQSFYSIKWYAADRRVTTYIKIISAGLIKPIRPLLLGLVAINFEVFCLMLRSTYSFYNFLMLKSIS